MRPAAAILGLSCAALAGCFGPWGPPVTLAVGTDLLIRKAQGERDERRWEIPDLVSRTDGGIDALLARAKEACPTARDRLDATDYDTIRLRRWGPVARTDRMEQEVEAWLAVERARP